MSVTTTASFSYSVEDLVGHISYIIKWRLSGTSIWAQMSTSGTTASIPGLAINMIYDFQVINVNGSDNPASAISQGINITDPTPTITPTNISAGYQFHNLSTDMTSYTGTVALASTPGSIISTHVLSPGAYPGIVTDTFTGLSADTGYVLNITAAAGPFTKTFIYPFTTTAQANCPAPTGVYATLS